CSLYMGSGTGLF
nr:immunoglobulin light chain junction region [Macaca mulatta]MPO03358.1 immunoglobulin light chain junction region [Macaca mulatta]MPO03379.1 immunoglobulin light chain junction region [Macaca mulatta]MPO03479.1 immunoglobulin light chain junction region [Macaca mulatta]MPO03572.1 immunoglobulin light chain junction region [Macaca mulatta]